MKKLSIDLKYLFVIWGVLTLSVMLTYSHHGHLIIDCGREAYYPTQVMLGKILYKDIFNIYGPFAYMFNALLFKIFGVNLNVLYLAGCGCSFLVTTFIYLISKQYLSKFLSFSISVFTVVIGVLSLNLFNFIFPYSYGMLYGLVSFLISFWFILKYQGEPEKFRYLCFGSFFAGLCVTSKYEFLPYLIVILYSAIKFKRLNFKEFYYAVFSLLAAPVFCFGVLFLQGLRVQDLISTISIIKTMAKSETLKYFYSTQGIYFNKNTLALLVDNLIKTAGPACLLLYGCSLKKKILSPILVTLALLLIILITNPSSFMFLPLFVVILGLINIKSLKENPKLLLLTLSCVAILPKIFFGLATLNYGSFFISFILLTFIALLLDKFKEKYINQKVLGIYILLVAAIFSFQNFVRFRGINSPVQSSYGKIYSEKYFSESTNQLIEYINKNTKKADTVVIFPEGLMVNFLTQRPSDNTYNSLIPLYVESFGDKKIIEHFKESKPEYIIFNNWNTKDYYQEYICKDYANQFCSFVYTNYSQEKVIDNGFRYLIFKLRG